MLRGLHTPLAYLAMMAWLACLAGCAERMTPAVQAPPSQPEAVSAAKPPPPPAVAAMGETHVFDSGARGLRAPGLLTYTSKPWGFDTKSYFLEGSTGLIMIDTQFLPSATEEAVKWAEATTHLAVNLAIVLHANPDKFNGTATLQARGVRVVTSSAIAALIPAVHDKRKGWFFERYAPDYPAALPKPEALAPGVSTISAAGLTLKLHALGAGCSEAHLVVQYDGHHSLEASGSLEEHLVVKNERHLFVGDLVASGTHAWLELGLVAAWNARLDELAAMNPQHVHPGRGPSGGGELIATQKRYLAATTEEVASAIRNARDPAEPSDAELAAVRDALFAKYPDLGYRVFLGLGLPAVWRHEASAAAQR